jgi:putative two-component system response regulator
MERLQGTTQPTASERQEKGERPGSMSVSEPLLNPALPGMRILLVDDERRIMQGFALMIGDYGHQLTMASSAQEALRCMSEKRFDIAFLDHYIGKDRGLDLMEKMAAMDPNLYFVMMTGNGNTDLAVEALKRGASDFITKPFFTADIIKCLDFVNKKRELDRQKRDLLVMLEEKIQERTYELESVYVEVLSSFAQVLETRDFSTSGHCKRVSHYARKIGDKAGLSAEELRYLEIGALLHDVGKVGISDVILLKPESLSAEEWRDLKSHPVKGVEILKPLTYLEPSLPGILHHHENFDGTGYPAGLRGTAIPLNARIIAVADSWDVMRSDRPYRKALDRERAEKELREFAGRQFDPDIVELFLDIL